jgi:ADP-ribose pyrophosphatase
MNERGQVALVEHYRVPFDDYFWEIPAGGIRPAEDLLDGARRELLEEVGATAEELRVLGTFAPSPGLSTTRAVAVLGIRAVVVRLPISNPEIRTVEFVPLDTAISRLMESPLFGGGSLLALFLAREAINVIHG